MCLGLFVVGFLCGSVSQRRADAQLPGVGQGALGSVTELGSSIVEMQGHVDGLQKDLETLKKIQRRPWRRAVARSYCHQHPETGLLKRISR
jgi:hypothetical protein